MYTVKWLRVLLFNTNSVQNFICTQSNGSKYCYVIPIIQFRHPGKEFYVLLFSTNNSIHILLTICITNNSIRQSFVYTQLNGQTVLFLTIQFSISHLFAQFAPFQMNPSAMAMKKYSTFPKTPGREPHHQIV